MSKFAWIKYEYKFLRSQGMGRIRASFKALIECFAALPF